MYNIKDVEKETSLKEMKIGIKASIVSLLSIQLIFQAFVLGYIQIISYFQVTPSFHMLSPQGLSSFAVDMWLMAILLSLFLVGYFIVQKAKGLPLYLLITYPIVLIILSMVRDVSLLHVLILSLLSFAVVLRINFQKAKQLEFANA